jgi:hypothetical protein
MISGKGSLVSQVGQQGFFTPLCYVQNDNLWGSLGEKSL